MNHVQNIAAFIQQPYEEMLSLVGRLLVRRGLRLIYEIDIKKRLEQELGIEWNHTSTVLIVDDPCSLYEALLQDSFAALHVLHCVVVTGDHSATWIGAKVWPAPQRSSEGAMARSIGSQVGERIADVIKSIAEHYDAIMMVRSPSTSATTVARADDAQEYNAEPHPALPA
jgi:hypothetical protein